MRHTSKQLKILSTIALELIKENNLNSTSKGNDINGAIENGTGPMMSNEDKELIARKIERIIYN